MVRLRIHVAVLRGHILDLILACIGVVGQLILDLFLFLAGNLILDRSERPFARIRIPCQFDRLFSCLTICKAMRPRLDRLVILIQIQLCIFDCHRASGHAVLRGYSADLIISRTVPRKGISADIGNMRSTIVDMFHQNSNRVLQERIGRSNLGNFLFPDRIQGGFGRSHGDAAVGLILDSTTLGGAPTLEVITLKGRSCARNGEGGTAGAGFRSLRSRRVFTAIGIIVQGILDFRIGLGLGAGDADAHRGGIVLGRVPFAVRTVIPVNGFRLCSSGQAVLAVFSKLRIHGVHPWRIVDRHRADIGIIARAAPGGAVIHSDLTHGVAVFHVFQALIRIGMGLFPIAFEHDRVFFTLIAVRTLVDARVRLVGLGNGLGDIHRVFHGAIEPLRIRAGEWITILAEGVVKTDGNDRPASLLGCDIDLQAVCAVKIAALPCADDNVLLAVIRLLHFHDIRVAGGRLCAAVGHGIIGGSGVSAGHLIDGHHFELAIPAGLQRVAGSERLVTDQ